MCTEADGAERTVRRGRGRIKTQVTERLCFQFMQGRLRETHDSRLMTGDGQLGFLCGDRPARTRKWLPSGRAICSSASFLTVDLLPSCCHILYRRPLATQN